MIRRLVFDLDDTLIRSDHIFSEFISFSGEDAKIDRLLYPLAGRSYHEIVKIITHQVDERFATEFMDSYLHWYDTFGWQLHSPFENIQELLTVTQAFSKSDIPIVTNKRCSAARRILGFFFPRIRFDVRGIGEIKEVDKKYHLMSLREHFEDTADLVYVGDTLGDKKDAKNSGVDFAGARWKKKPEEFPLNTKCFSTPTDLLEWALC